MSPEIDLRGHSVSCVDATTQAFDRLAVKDGFVFVADHDPTALRYMLEAEQGRAVYLGCARRGRQRGLARAGQPRRGCVLRGSGALSVMYGTEPRYRCRGMLPERMTAHHG